MRSIVRRVGADEAAIVALLGRLTFRETFSALFVGREDELRHYLDRTFDPAKIAASLGKRRNCYWLASIDGLPVGYAKLKLESPNPAITASAPAQLQKIYVLAEFVAQRLGGALMAAVLAEGARLQNDALWLNVLASNERAISFYRRRGWTPAGEATFDIGSQSFLFLTLVLPLSRQAASNIAAP